MTSPSRQAGTAGLQQVTGASGTTFAPSKPTASASGKLLLGVYYTEAVGTITMPTGFANAIDVVNTFSGQNTRIRMDWKIADGSEGATLSWSWTGSVWRLGALFSIDGAETTGTPVELGSSSNNGNAAAQVAPNVALTGNATVDDFVVLAGAYWNGGTWSAPATWTLEFNTTDNFGIGSIAQASGGAPATNHMVFTQSGSQAVASGIIAVKSPAGGAAATSLVMPHNALAAMLGR